VVPSHLIELGRQLLAHVTANVALVRCQLLASVFYEALKLELRVTSELGAAERGILVAAVNQCHHAATASTSPGAMLGELRSAMGLLQSCGLPPSTRLRPMLRVIEGSAPCERAATGREPQGIARICAQE
jgi:hypothetical protein